MPESREPGKGDFLRISQNFQELLFCKRSVNAYLCEMKQRKNIFTETYSQKNTGDGTF